MGFDALAADDLRLERHLRANWPRMERHARAVAAQLRRRHGAGPIPLDGARTPTEWALRKLLNGGGLETFLGTFMPKQLPSGYRGSPVRRTGRTPRRQRATRSSSARSDPGDPDEPEPAVGGSQRRSAA